MKALLFLTLTGSYFAFGQMRMNQNLYMFNQSLYNPGYIDIQNETGIFAGFKQQYTRQNSSPQTISLNAFHNLRSNHGLGIVVINDRFNNYNQFEAGANYNYNVWLGEETVLSAGVKVNFSQQSNAQNAYTYFDAEEPTLTGVQQKTSFGIGSGIALISKDFDLNIALPFLFHNQFSNDNSTINVQRNHLYASMGYKFRANDNFIIYPTTFIKGVAGSPLSISGDLNFLINQKFWLGAGFKTSMSATAIAGIFFDSGWQFMYSFETSPFSSFSGAGMSHEISLAYTIPFKELGFKKRKFIGRGGQHRPRRW